MGYVSGRAHFKKNLNDFKEQPDGDKLPQNPSSISNSTATGHWRAVLEAIQWAGRYRLPDLTHEVLAAIRKIGGIRNRRPAAGVLPS